MHLIIVRHGNTFEHGQTPRWLGANEDLPLTAEGQTQIERLANSLRSCGLTPKLLLTSPLRRAQQSADILSNLCSAEEIIPCKIDDRLSELDYGNWSNKTDDEIVKLYGSESLSRWRKSAVFPETAGFFPTLGDVEAQCQSLLRDLLTLNHSTIGLVSSNGRVRFIYRAALAGKLTATVTSDSVNSEPIGPGSLRTGTLRTGTLRTGTLRTGHVGLFEYYNGQWACRFWDLSAEALHQVCRRSTSG